MSGMSTDELIEELRAIADRLRVIRRDDPGGWIPEVKGLLSNLELEIVRVAVELENRR